MPHDDAFAFLGKMAEDDGFRDLVTIPWGKGSWRLHTPVIWSSDRFVSTPFVQIYFPKQQIADVLKVLEACR